MTLGEGWFRVSCGGRSWRVWEKVIYFMHLNYCTAAFNSTIQLYFVRKEFSTVTFSSWRWQSSWILCQKLNAVSTKRMQPIFWHECCHQKLPLRIRWVMCGSPDPFFFFFWWGTVPSGFRCCCGYSVERQFFFWTRASDILGKIEERLSSSLDVCTDHADLVPLWPTVVRLDSQ